MNGILILKKYCENFACHLYGWIPYTADNGEAKTDNMLKFDIPVKCTILNIKLPNQIFIHIQNISI